MITRLLPRISYRFFLLFIPFLSSVELMGQETNLDSLAREATDPTAVIWQLQLEDFWAPVQSEDGRSFNQFRVRAVIPMTGKVPGRWDHLLRITTRSQNTDQASLGIGDTEIFDLIIPKRFAWGALGIGPLLSLPTATNNRYGSGKFAVGLASGIAFNNPKMGNWQVDLLLQYLVSIAGDSEREEVRSFAFQPSITYHFKKGFYLETEPVLSYSFTRKHLVIPVNLRFGKVLTIGTHRYNIYIEPETTAYTDQDLYTVFGCRFGFRFLFRE